MDDPRARLKALIKEKTRSGWSSERIQAEMPSLIAEVKVSRPPSHTAAPSPRFSNVVGASSSAAPPPTFGNVKGASSSTAPEPTEPSALDRADDWLLGAAQAVRGGMASGVSLGALGPEPHHKRTLEQLTHIRRLRAMNRSHPLATDEALRRAEQEEAQARSDLTDSQEHPYLTTAGDITAGLLYGAGSKAAQMIGKIPVKRQLAKGVSGEMGHASAQVLGRDAAAGAVGSAVESGGRALAEGQSLEDAGRAAAASAFFGGMLGPIPRASAGYLRDKRHLSGRQIVALDRGRQFLQSDDFKRLDDGLSGVGQLATDEGEILGALQAQKLADARARLKAVEESLPGMDEAVDIPGVHQRLDQGVRHLSNKRVLRPDVAGVVDELKADLSRDIPTFRAVPEYQPAPLAEPAPPPPAKPRAQKPTKALALRPEPWEMSGAIPVEGEAPFQRTLIAPPASPGRDVKRVKITPPRRKRELPPVDILDAMRAYEPPAPKAPPPPKSYDLEQAGTTRVPMATPADLLAVRRKVSALAEHGMPQTPQNAPYRELGGVMSQATHADDLPNNIGATLGQADEQFARDMDLLEYGNARLFGPEDARAVTDSNAARRAAANKLQRAVGDTQAAGMRVRELEEIAKLGPEYAEALDRVKAKLAFEGTRFVLSPRLFSHSGNWQMGPLLSNINATRARILDPPAQAAMRSPGLIPQLTRPSVDLLDALMGRRKTEPETQP